MRMSIRRFTWLTNAFSKKVENLRAAVNLHFAYYNLARFHRSLGMPPGLAAKVIERPWSIDDLVSPLKLGHYPAVQWLANIGIVMGSALLTVRHTEGGVGGIFLHRSFYPLMLAAFFTGAAHVIGKSALDELPVLFTHGLRMFALGSVLLVFNFRYASLADLRSYFTQRSPALLFVSGNELVIANVGLLLLLRALSEGPASLVIALAGTRALFLVLYSTSLALVWRGALGEHTSPGAIAMKVGATALVATGVAIIAV